MVANLPKPGDVFTFNGNDIGVITNTKIRSDGRDLERITLKLVSPSGAAVSTQGVTVPTGAVFDMPNDRKPYRGTLLGRIKIRYRIKDYAKIYISDPYHVREFLLVDKGDYITHGTEISRNQRTTPRKTNDS